MRKDTKESGVLSASEAGRQASPLDQNSKKSTGRPARADRPQCRQADLKGMDALGLKRLEDWTWFQGLRFK